MSTTQAEEVAWEAALEIIQSEYSSYSMFVISNLDTGYYFASKLSYMELRIHLIGCIMEFAEANNMTPLEFNKSLFNSIDNWLKNHDENEY